MDIKYDHHGRNLEISLVVALKRRTLLHFEAKIRFLSLPCFQGNFAAVDAVLDYI